MAKHLAFVLALTVAASITSGVNAGFFAKPYTGNSQTLKNDGGIDIDAADGLINFAVYVNDTGADWRTDLGITAASPLSNTVGFTTGGEKYVYFYQMVNTNPAGLGGFFDSGLSLLQIGVVPPGPGGFSSGGYITTTGGVNLDFAGLSVGTLNPPDPTPGDGAPGTDYAAFPGFVPDATAEAPLSVAGPVVGPGQFGLTSAFYQFTFLTPIATGGYSSVVFLTSDTAPTYVLSKVHDGTNTNGDAPSPGPPGTALTPEPTSFVMLFGTLICCGLGAVKFKKSQGKVSN